LLTLLLIHKKKQKMRKKPSCHTHYPPPSTYHELRVA
jgi:hypothetical protein